MRLAILLRFTRLRFSLSRNDGYVGSVSTDLNFIVEFSINIIHIRSDKYISAQDSLVITLCASDA
jgi:hypothetical protein